MFHLSANQKISFVECDINDWLISCFEFPDSLRSIHLERLNLSSERIQSLVNRLPPSMESIEIVKWIGKETDNPYVSLSLARFSSLKEFQLEDIRNFRFNIYHLLISLANVPLETIRISSIILYSSEWISVIQEWNVTGRNLLYKSLQVFNVKTEDMYDDIASQFIQFLLSFPQLKVLCFKKNWTKCRIPLPPIPQQLRQFMLSGLKRFF